MNLIVAVDSCWGIGKNNDLLFKLPQDMKFFRETTTGKTVVMGANTFLSFPNGALPRRVNVVLDASGAKHEGTVSVSTLDELEKVLQGIPAEDIFVIGGASVYRLLLHRCKTAFVTKVYADGNADVFFPNLDQNPEWQLIEQSEKIRDGEHFISFCKYENLSAKQ